MSQLFKAQRERTRKPKMQEETKNILVVGDIGAGKSAFCNLCLHGYGCQENLTFEESDNAGVCTLQCNISAPRHMFSSPLYTRIRVIDSRGFNDPTIADALNMVKVVKFMQQVQKIHTICIVFNYHNPRCDQSVLNLIQSITEIFKLPSIYSKIVIVFTRYTEANNVLPQRKQRRADFVSKISSQMNLNFTLPFYFVDCQHSYGEMAQNAALSNFKAELDRLYTWVTTAAAFDCDAQNLPVPKIQNQIQKVEHVQSIPSVKDMGLFSQNNTNCFSFGANNSAVNHLSVGKSLANRDVRRVLIKFNCAIFDNIHEATLHSYFRRLCKWYK